MKLASDLWVVWFSVLSVFIALVTVHVLATRRKWFENKLRLAVFLLVLGAASVMALVLLAYQPIESLGATLTQSPIVAAVTTVLLLVGLYGLFVEVYCVVNTSIRLRMCVEVHRSKEKGLKRSAILETYDPQAASAERYERLIVASLIEKQGQTVVLSKKGKRLGQLFHLAKAFYKT